MCLIDSEFWNPCFPRDLCTLMKSMWKRSCVDQSKLLWMQTVIWCHDLTVVGRSACQGLGDYSFYLCLSVWDHGCKKWQQTCCVSSSSVSVTQRDMIWGYATTSPRGFRELEKMSLCSAINCGAFSGLLQELCRSRYSQLVSKEYAVTQPACLFWLLLKCK